jgi:hypothetical protein
MRPLFSAVLFASIAACSSSSNSGGSGAGAGGLDCAWLAGDNCYKQAVAASASCLPAMGDKGVLSQDATTCTYPSGQVVTFDEPLVLPAPLETKWKFTITSQGQMCLRWVEGSQQGQFTLTTGAGTFTENTTGFGLELTCPDGHSVSNSNALELFGCEGGLPAFPGTEWTSSDTSVSLGLLGTTGGLTPVFNCAKP